MSEEKLPVSEKLKVLQSYTIYKSEKWWSAVVLVEAFGRKQVAIYLWTKKGDQWKRKQKYVFHDKGEWLQVKEVVDKLINKLSET